MHPIEQTGRRTHGRCVPATCRSGEDCDFGECGLSIWISGGCYPKLSFHCRDPTEDECRSNDDCDSDLCAWDGLVFRCAQECSYTL